MITAAHLHRDLAWRKAVAHNRGVIVGRVIALPRVWLLASAMLVGLAVGQIAGIAADHRLIRRTPKTIVSRARLLQELDTVRRQGYATSEAEHFPGVRAIAAPIVDATGAVIAAVSATGLISQPIWVRPRGVIDLVKLTARDISRRMNGF